MTPKTLEIIRKEAEKLYPVKDQRRDVFSSDNKQWQKQLAYAAGAKRGYELAMNDDSFKKDLMEALNGCYETIGQQVDEISRLKKENEELRKAMKDAVLMIEDNREQLWLNGADWETVNYCKSFLKPKPCS